MWTGKCMWTQFEICPIHMYYVACRNEMAKKNNKQIQKSHQQQQQQKKAPQHHLHLTNEMECLKRPWGHLSNHSTKVQNSSRQWNNSSRHPGMVSMNMSPIPRIIRQFSCFCFEERNRTILLIPDMTWWMISWSIESNILRTNYENFSSWRG